LLVLLVLLVLSVAAVHLIVVIHASSPFSSLEEQLRAAEGEAADGKKR